MASFDKKLAMAKHCSHVELLGGQHPPAPLPIPSVAGSEGVVAGAKAAMFATIATAIPTMASARMLPWAKAHLNHTAQALIVSTVAGAAYFIVADRTILKSARRNSFKNTQP